MGLGLPRTDRLALLGDAVCTSKRRATGGGADRTMVIDLNAAIRNYARPGASPQQIASTLMRVSTPEAVKRVFAMFDCAAQLPAIRTGLHARRYAGVSALGEVETATMLRELRPGLLHLPARDVPVDYAKAFVPGPVKALMWEVFHAAVWHAAVGRSRGRLIQVHGPSGTAEVVGQPLATPKYAKTVQPMGEADLKCFAVAAREAMKGREVVIKSVDTDLILQTVAHGLLKTEPFVPKRRFMIMLKSESVDGQKLIARFGGADPSARLSCAFWMVMAGGCDYAKAASDQGYYKKELLAHATDGTAPVLHVAPNRRVTLRVRRLLQVLARGRRRGYTKGGARKTKGAGKKAPARPLKQALVEAAASVCYYGGYTVTGVVNEAWELGHGDAVLV